MRNLPARPRRHAVKLGQGHEAHFRVPRVDELERLRDAIALHDLGLERVVDAERLHRFDSGGPVRRGDRIGDRQFREIARFQRLLAIGHVDHLAPKRELADRIGEAAVSDGEALLDRRLRALFVGCEEDLERRVVGYLGEEGASSAEAQHGFVSRLLLEESRDFLGRLGEIRRNGHVSHARLSLRRERGEKRQKCDCKRGRLQG